MLFAFKLNAFFKQEVRPKMKTKTKTTVSKDLKIVGWRDTPNSLTLEPLGSVWSTRSLTKS